MLSLAMGGGEGDGGARGDEGLEKTLDLRMQELILSTKVKVGPPPTPIGEGESSPSGEEVRNTSDRRTDPNMSCILSFFLRCFCD